MIFVIVIFFIAIIFAFSMLSYRAWEIRTNQIVLNESESEFLELSFRRVERTILYIAKHVIQAFVLVVMKYWILGVTKTRKWIMENWPKVYNRLKKNDPSPTPIKPSFFTKALMESKTKISRMKQKIREEHDMQ